MLLTDREIPQVTIDIDVKDDLPDYYDYIRLQDRSGLMYPTDTCMHITMLALESFGAIINDSERSRKLTSLNSAETIFCRFFCEISAADSVLGSLEGTEGHLVTNSIQSVARSLFHAFGKNVVSRANSIHSGYTGKRPADDEDNGCGTRSRTSY